MRVYEDVWGGLYGESWKGLIHDEAFAHPAKYSRALIRKIYDHVAEEGWANPETLIVSEDMLDEIKRDLANACDSISP